MEPFVRDRYLEELVRQSKFALRAFKALNAALKAPDAEEVFRSAHSSLTHVSNVSRLLWPPKRRHKRTGIAKERSDELRGLLSLPDDYILADRRLRDHLEHYDERLDDWARTSRNRKYVDMNLAPIGWIQGVKITDIMRQFDPTTNIFYFRGEEFPLQPIVAAIERVLTKASQILKCKKLKPRP